MALQYLYQTQFGVPQCYDLNNGNSFTAFQNCCDAGYEEACATYTFANGACTVSPATAGGNTEWDYSLLPGDCCKAYEAQGSESLLEECIETVETQVCHREVYEDETDVCDSVTINRQVYMATETEVGAITYSAEDTPSTALRCCLASEDFPENSMACMEEVVESEEFVFDPNAPPGEQCIKVDFTQTNRNAPGAIARVITVVFGDKTETGREFVGNDVCCLELDEGCDEDEPGTDDFQDVVCIPGPTGPCDTCNIQFYETTDFFVNPLGATADFVKNVVGLDLMTEENASRERCCAAGVQLRREDAIQACLEDDGEPDVELEVNDMGECIARAVQPQRYAQADGSGVLGFGIIPTLLEPVRTVVDAEIVSGDVCCRAGCESTETASLLAACASRTEELSDPVFSIDGDFGPLALGILFQPQCIAEVTLDITFTLTTGEVACMIDSVNTYSTEFSDDDVVTMMHCCEAAVVGGATDAQLSTFCEEDEEITPNSEVDFIDGLLPGTGRCIMVDGEVISVWKDADGVVQRYGTAEELDGQEIDKKLCCTAYDENDPINNDLELTFACEEIEVTNEITEYDPETGVCRTDVEDFYYVDLDANEEYDPAIDGEQYDYVLTENIDASGDECCRKAGEEGDLETATAICDRCVEEDADEFFTYDAPVCTRRFDRTTTCFTTAPFVGDLIGNPLQDPTLVDERHCLEEVLPAEDCCEAKRQGKAGSGLEEACGTFSFPDFIGNVVVGGVDLAGNVVDLAGNIIGAGLDASGNVLDAAGNIIGKAFDSTGNFLTPVLDASGNLVDIASNVIVGGLDAAGNVLDTAGNIIGAGLDASGNILDAAGNVLGIGVNAAGGLLEPALDITGNVIGLGLDAAGNVIGGVAGLASDVFVGGLDASGNVLDAAGNIIGAGLDASGNILDAAGNVIGVGVDAAGDLLTPVLDLTGNVIGTGLDAAGNIIGGAAGLAGDVLVAGLNAAGNPIDAAGNILGAGLDASGNILDAAGNVIGQGVDVAGNLLEPVLDLGGNVIGAGLDVTGAVAGAVGDIAGNVADAGLNAAGGLIDAGLGLAGAGTNAAGDVAGGLIDAGLNAAGTGLDLAGGAADAGLNLAGDVIDDPLAAAGNAANLAGNVAGGVADAGLNVVGGAADAVGGFIGGLFG